MKDSRSLTDEEEDRIAERVIEKLGQEGRPREESRQDEEGWYLGKYASEFVERVAEGASSGQATAIQDDLRRVGERFFKRNAIYKTKVQKAGRVAIPEAEQETLGLDGGQTVQIIMFPIGNSKEE